MIMKFKIVMTMHLGQIQFPTVYSVLRQDPLLPVHLVVSGAAPQPPHRHDGGHLRQGHQLSVSAQRSGAGGSIPAPRVPDPISGSGLCDFFPWIRNSHCQ
jgi:hypothetical protein